jgi:glycosyltransferase involved in cell wall biosynthesis
MLAAPQDGVRRCTAALAKLNLSLRHLLVYSFLPKIFAAVHLFTALIVSACESLSYNAVKSEIANNCYQKGRRLLFICNDTRFFFSHRIDLAANLVNSGYEVHLAAFDNGKAVEICAHGIKLYDINIDRSGLNPLQDLLLFAQLLRAILRIRPDLVHAFTIKPILYGGLACCLLRFPAFVGTVSGLGYAFTGSGWTRRVLRRVILLLYGFILSHPRIRLVFQNPDDRALLVRHKPRVGAISILIRGSGVDLAVFHTTPPPPLPIIILLPARLLWDKGVKEFVATARQLRPEFPDVRFVLAGESPEHNRLRVPVETINGWVAEGVVEWWGYQEDMPAVYAASHIVCLPSYYGEGVPKCLLEAAACGRPIVTTNWPGCREVVQNRQGGLLVPPRSVTALATALRELICDPELRRTLGACSRRVAEQSFSIESVIELTKGVYDDLIGPRRESTNPLQSTLELVRHNYSTDL